jgi:hypothetical protein
MYLRANERLVVGWWQKAAFDVPHVDMTFSLGL